MPPHFTLFCLCAVLLAELPAVEVRLAGPLTTTVDLVGEFPAGASALSADIVVPADAPRDLHVGAFASEDGGGWRQSSVFRPLPPGSHRIALTVPGNADPATRAIGGLMFCSTAPGSGVRLDVVRVQPAGATGSLCLLDLAWDGARGPDQARIATGQPWQVRLRPGRVAGFVLGARVTVPDGTVTRVAATPPPRGTVWTLAYTPPEAGTYRIELEGRWGADQVGHRLELTASGPAPLAIAPTVVRLTAGEALPLRAPLRTSLGRPITEASAAWRISARLLLPPDAPEDLSLGAYVRDDAGRCRSSTATMALRPGEQTIRLVVPAGAAEAGAGEAGIALWSARISQAEVRVLDLRAEPVSGGAAGEPCLDRLQLVGVDSASGRLQTAVGSTWSASVLPVPAAGESAGLHVAVSARITDAAGRSDEVPATVEESGRQRVDFHPSIPGSYAIELLGRWSDGRQVACPLPPLTVTGEHPCRDGRALSLRAPLATVLPLRLGAAGEAHLVTATVLVPDGAPADLAVAVAAVDHHDRWYEPLRHQALRPGINHLDLPIDRRAALAAAPGNGAWNENALAQFERSALVFISASPAPLQLTVGEVQARPMTDAEARRTPRLLALASAPGGRTGERWSLTLRPDPFPANPFDPEDFRLDLLVTTPEGVQLQLPGFYAEDMQANDRGDREELSVLGSGRFEVRYRPRTPGQHRLTLQASWRDGGRVTCALPPLSVAGAAWDGYVRVDQKDPRFFTVDGRFYWPSGPNLRSVWDLRSRDRMHTRLTADRGSLAYLAYLRRFAAAGANACEIWMSAWNLALEWRRDWPGYDGVGRYNQENAWRLDRILDAAWAEGMRVNLVINNHGQASDSCDAEWANNPYNRLAGGRLDAAAAMFHDPWAKLGQAKLRRYLIGRYADHPAVLGWKLWTEINLTNGRHFLHPWHAQAVPRWRAEDPYGHPVATHWSSDYRVPDHTTARLLDYVCIDAYHGDGGDDPYRLLHRLLRDSTLAADRGLAVLGRPILVTEYGGSPGGTRTDALMQVEHACSAWVAFVSGHAGAPMLWWFEWIDQGGRFAPYGAISRFIAGEQLRGDGRPAVVRALAAGRLWSAAWRTRDRLFGYVIDERWAADGTTARQVNAQIALDEAWPAGRLLCEWWDPELGVVVARQTIGHPGGTLLLTPPGFTRHLAWKILVQR